MAAVYLKQLKRKLRSLATHGRTHPTQNEIAGRLGIKPPTLTGWLGGRDNKEGGQVPYFHLDTLASILISESPHELTMSEARALWIGDLEDFEVAVSNAAKIRLDDVLHGNGQKLTVTFHPTGDGFGLDEDAVDCGVHPIPVADGTAFYLSAACEPRRRLIVLSNFSTGWRVLAPGILHSGHLSVAPAVYPDSGRAPLRFDASYGLRRYVFIEHAARLNSSLPAHVRGVDALDIDALSRFARRLVSEEWAGKWRWGQVALVAERKPAPQAEKRLTRRS